MKLKGESLFFIGIVVVSILVVAGAVIFSTNGTSSEVSDDLLVKENSQTKGPEDARVILVEFSDFQCPACKAAFPIIKKITEEEYKDKIRFVYRHFPLPVHDNAREAAEAAEAAGNQGKFWEYHDLLFDRQDVWGQSSDPKQLFEEYAQELELDIDKFKKDIDEHKFTSKVEGDTRDGNAAGVSSTPTFFLNGEKMVGVPKPEDLKTKIDAILSQSP